jgi:hypothetical protein
MRVRFDPQPETSPEIPPAGFVRNAAFYDRRIASKRKPISRLIFIFLRHSRRDLSSGRARERHL